MCQCIVLADVLTGDLTRCHHISSFIVQTSGAAYECISCCQWKLPATNMESSDDEPSEWPIYLWLLLLKCILSDREYRATFDFVILRIYLDHEKMADFYLFFFNTQATDLLGAKHLLYYLFSYFRLFIPLFSVIYSFIAIIKCARQAIYLFFSQDAILSCI